MWRVERARVGYNTTLMGKNEVSADDAGEVTAWLKEVGKRVVASPANGKQVESAEEVLEYLSTLTGRPMRTREDVRGFLESAHRERIAAEKSLARQRLQRESLLLFLLAGAYLQYYYWDVALQIENLPRLITLVS
jgi:hypothetical protein